MAASLEITSGIVRYGGTHTIVGTKFEGAFVLDPDGDVAVLKGGTGSLCMKDLGDIVRVLILAGFTSVRWHRWRPGGVKVVTYKFDRQRWIP